MTHLKSIIAGIMVLFSAISYQSEVPDTAPMKRVPEFGHAMGLYESGGYEGAASEAEQIAASDTGIRWKARARYLAGRAYASIPQMEKAEKNFQEALVTLPELKPYALFKLAKGYEKAGDPLKAAEYYARVAEEFPESGLKAEALLSCGNIQSDQGMHRLAEKTFLDLLKARPPRDMRARAHYVLMKSQAVLGSMDTAYYNYNAIWKVYPGSGEMPGAQELLDKMVKAGYKPKEHTASDILERADGLSDYGMNLEAAKEYGKALGMMDAEDVRISSSLLNAGKAFFLARKDSNAAVALRKVLSDFPDSQEAPSALYWLARTQLRIGDDHGLGLTVARLEDEFPDHPNTPLTIYYLGSELMADEEYDKAAMMLRKVSESYPASNVVDDALWKLGWVEYLTGDYEAAADAFGELSVRYKGAIYEAGGEYWQAKSLMKAGRKKEGQRLLDGLAKGYKLSYYGWAAAGDGKRFVMDDGISPPDAGRPPRPEDTYKDKNLSLAYELCIQRMRDDAMEVLRKEERRYGATVNGIKVLAGLYGMVDEYRRPLELASALYQSRMDSGRSPIPENAMELIFPAGYWEVIWAESKKNGVDPFLVASLIREESHFDPRAVSPAGAMGLMQMMPSTAAEVCRRLDMSPPSEDDLKDGTYNVPLGVCHLSYLIEKHNGRIVYILAEYNAGPNALKRWRERMPEDISDDEFVERIGYRETRNYIKRVMRNYYVYKDLYGS